MENKESDVPGLSRGIEILDLLNKNPGLGLEGITVKTGYPKASVLRVLNTLAQHKLLKKEGQTKNYFPLARLERFQTDNTHFLVRLEKELHALAKKCDCTAEWYIASDKGLVIAKSISSPESAVSVHARPGFIRQWTGELEAVVQIGLRFAPQAPSLTDKKFWGYDAQGKKRGIKPDEAQNIIAKLSKLDITLDIHYNTNGIRRMALGLFDEKKFHGILSLAMPFTPGFEKEIPKRKQKLMEAVERLQHHI